ncbi:MAG: sulfite exporter TauE/SafE family protein [Asticcacaulis sp.]
MIFLLVGLLAQTVDGSLGMGYGVTASSVLLAMGVPPAAASASAHTAKLFTTATAGISHVFHQNVKWRLFFPLVLGGAVGGILGTTVLTGVDGDFIRPFIVAYLLIIGLYILYRGLKGVIEARFPSIWAAPLGVVGGFLDAIGGGGWGPTVTSTMVGAGLEPRKAVGTVNTSEFFVTCVISATFIWALVTGHWQEAGNLMDHAVAVGGLVVGGLIAAPFAGWLTKRIPTGILTLLVGVLIIVLAGYQLARLLGVI